jgi:hypothetical protein
MLLAVAGAWLVLALAQDPLVRAFSLDGLAASFFFIGALFVANAIFGSLAM